jgi:hypothetical protein
MNQSSQVRQYPKSRRATEWDRPGRKGARAHRGFITAAGRFLVAGSCDFEMDLVPRLLVEDGRMMRATTSK